MCCWAEGRDSRRSRRAGKGGDGGKRRRRIGIACSGETERAIGFRAGRLVAAAKAGSDQGGLHRGRNRTTARAQGIGSQSRSTARSAETSDHGDRGDERRWGKLRSSAAFARVAASWGCAQLLGGAGQPTQRALPAVSISIRRSKRFVGPCSGESIDRRARRAEGRLSRGGEGYPPIAQRPWDGAAPFHHPLGALGPTGPQHLGPWRSAHTT